MSLLTCHSGPHHVRDRLQVGIQVTYCVKCPGCRIKSGMPSDPLKRLIWGYFRTYAAMPRLLGRGTTKTMKIGSLDTDAIFELYNIKGDLMTNLTNNSDTYWPLGMLPVLGSTIPESMQALTIHRNDYGPPSQVIRMETVPTPLLRDNDTGRVLVAILASGPNYNTNFAALGLPVPVFGRGDSATIHIPGSDALGIVVDAGSAVTRVKVGQVVILDSWTGRSIRGYETHDGFNAQFAVVDEGRAIPVPESLQNHSPESLAAMLLTYGTAYRAILERLKVRPGESVLIMGGGKGTSFAGAQLAKAIGARVILMGSNPTLVNSLISRGLADAFVDRRAFDPKVFGVIDQNLSLTQWESKTESFRRAVREANNGRLVDKVFEHTGGANFPLLISALAPGGTLAFFGATGKGLKGEYKETFFYEGRRFVMDARWVWMRQKQILFPPRFGRAYFRSGRFASRPEGAGLGSRSIRPALYPGRLEPVRPGGGYRFADQREKGHFPGDPHGHPFRSHTRS